MSECLIIYSLAFLIMSVQKTNLNFKILFLIGSSIQNWIDFETLT